MKATNGFSTKHLGKSLENSKALGELLGQLFLLP
jgi:hypothetical protein